MNNSFLTLQEIIDLCKDKNYNDQTLGFRDRPGFVAERFRRGHAIMVLRSANAKAPKNFTIAFPTSSYNQQDSIQLKFNLDYNPAGDTLRLRGITAYLNPTEIEGKRQSEMQKIFLLPDTQDLPDSRKIYNMLTEHRTREARQVYQKITSAPNAHNFLHI